MTPKGSRQDERTEDDEASFAGIVNLNSTAPPPPNDVHSASTTVADLPPSVLELLKTGGAYDVTAELAKAASGQYRRPDDPDVEIGDLIDLALGADEPETMVLESVIVDDDGLSPASPVYVAAPPEVIELVAPPAEPYGGALESVDREIGRVPRAWVVAGALVASIMAASVAYVLVWSFV